MGCHKTPKMSGAKRLLTHIQKMSLEKGVTCFIWFMHIDGKKEQNILFLKMIQIRTNNTRSQSIADPRESGGAAK